VIDFWASWCGASRQFMPQLSVLQQRYADQRIVFIGINVLEQDRADAKRFLAEMTPPIGYSIAADEGDRIVQSWLAAAGIDALPCTFVFARDGTIAWIGHPMKLEPVLKQIAAATFDIKRSAGQRAVQEQLRQALAREIGAGQWDRALAMIHDYQQKQPDSAAQLSLTRFGVLVAKHDWDAAIRAAREAAQANQNDGSALNELAWAIVDSPELAKRDIELSLKCADRASELLGGKHAPALDTLARIHFELQDLEKAISLEREAVERAPARFKKQMQDALEKYRALRAATQGAPQIR